jgi:hypothetical protein
MNQFKYAYVQSLLAALVLVSAIACGTDAPKGEGKIPDLCDPSSGPPRALESCMDAQCDSKTGEWSFVPRFKGAECTLGPNPGECARYECDGAGTCITRNLDGQHCEDGNACTGSDTCQDGKCKGGVAPLCPQAGACEQAGCDPDSGCFLNPKADGSACSDDNACTAIDTCENGTCESGNAAPCSDGGTCEEAGCNPDSGCFLKPKADGTTCSDDNACTAFDTCQNGTCEGGNVPICPGGGACEDPGCDPASGCFLKAKANGTMCSDNNACTAFDTCQNGTCEGGNVPICPGGGACEDPGCDPVSGCFLKAKANGQECNDDNACTAFDSCQNGTCEGGNVPICPPGSQCQVAGCEPDNGCFLKSAENGTPCDDGDPATKGEICVDGGCIAKQLDPVVFRNDNASAMDSDLATASLSFEEGEYLPSELWRVKLGNLVTQVVPTSYYKTGKNNELYVRTAVARVLVSLSPGEELSVPIIDSEQTWTFQELPAVTSFLDDGQLTFYSKDLLGGEYSYTFSPKDATLIESGPVTRVYEVTRKLRPANAGADLPYLFTVKLFATVVSGQPHIKLDTMVINFGNLAEDQHSVKPDGTWTYVEGQNGLMFYDSIRFEVNTGSTSSTLRLLDADLLKPTYLQDESASKHVVWVMPTDGQAILTSQYNNPKLPAGITNPSNYIHPIQGLLTRATLTLSGAAPNYDYFEENRVSAGQSLARFNRVKGHFFSDIVRPDAIDPLFDFAADAKAQHDKLVGTAQKATLGHRFGAYNYITKDMGSSGFWPHYEQIPSQALRYLMSCHTTCQRDYLDAMRYYLYGSAHLTNHLPGYHPKSHPDSYLLGYRHPLLTQCDKGGKPDQLGMCDLNTSDAYRKDAAGNGFSAYFSANSRASAHDWTIRDDAHMSTGLELFRYMLAGDHMARFLARGQVDAVASFRQYFALNPPAWHGQARGRGRGLLNASRMFSVTGDAFYQDVAGYHIDVIDQARNKDTQSPGIHPVTGNPLPYKQLDGDKVGYCDGQADPSNKPATACRIQLFEETQILHGLVIAAKDAVVDPAMAQKVQTIVKDGLFYVFNFAYKRYDQVQNGVVGGNGVLLFEGQGGLARFNRVILGAPSPDKTGEMKAYTRFSYTKSPQLLPGICNAVSFAGTNEQKAEFADFFQRARVMVTIKNNNDAWGIRLSHLTDDNICGLRTAAGLPTADEANDCPDDDGDGYTTCVGDTDDSNAKIHPGAGENCTDGVDNNSNALTDCNDPRCGFVYAGNGNGINGGKWNIQTVCDAGQGAAGFCGDGIKQGTETCDFMPSEYVPYSSMSPMQNMCPLNRCLPPVTPGVAGCGCAQ